MAQDSSIKEFCVFDLNVAMVPPESVSADRNFIEKDALVKGFVMVVGMNPIDHLDLLNLNADIAKGIVEAGAKSQASQAPLLG